MSVARTTRGISKIPGVNTFRSAYQPSVPGLRVVSLDPCGKCRKEFNHLPDTPWDEVIQDVAEHVRFCERVTKAPDQMKRNGRNTDEEKKRDKKAKERQTILQQDPWAALVEPTRVRCGACGTLIQLDKRREFYPGLWNNHRARCPGIDQIFNRAERMLLSITREVFLLQDNSPRREFLNLYTVNPRERRKQAKRRKEGERRRNRRVAEDQMYDSGEDLHGAPDTSHSRDNSQDQRTSVSSNIAPEAMPPGLPTTSKSLNAILCPVAAEETQNHYKHLETSCSGQDQELQHVAYGAEVVGTGFRKSASSQKRYHPYGKTYRSMATRRRSQSIGMYTHSNSLLIGHKTQLCLYPDRKRCSIQPQNRVDDEFCVYGGQSSCINCSLSTTPNLRLGDLTSDNGTGSTRASSPSTTEGGREIQHYEEQNDSTFGNQVLDETCLRSPHYSPRCFPASFPPGSPVINISSLSRRLNYGSSCGDDFPPSLSQNQCDDDHHISKPLSQACYSVKLGNSVSSPVPRLRPLTADSFGRCVIDDCYDSDCSGEGL